MTCTEEQFLKDVKDHAVTVIRDDGVERHIRFREPGTMCYGFDLITWPGHLVVTGDCGTWVFQRSDDMFGFFRIKPHDFHFDREGGLSINTGYWAEKLLAVNRSGRAGGSEMEFSADLFKKNIEDWFNQHEFDSPEQSAECWAEIKDQILDVAESGDENAAYQAALSYEHKVSGFDFTDFYEVNSREYTFHYLWCLYAIVWGIREYDRKKLEVTPWHTKLSRFFARMLPVPSFLPR